MTDTNQIPTAISLGRDFSCANYASTEEALAVDWQEKGAVLIQYIRDKIEAVDWDNFDAGTIEAKTLLPILVSLAKATSEGRDVLEGMPLGGVEDAPRAFQLLKPIVEDALGNLERRLNLVSEGAHLRIN